MQKRARRQLRMAGTKAQEIAHARSAGSGIDASRRRILREIGAPSDVTFFTGPGNLGDELIYAGTRRLLAGVPHREVAVGRRKDAAGRRLSELDRIGGVRGHTALITGGGAWCGPFHGMWPSLLPLIERRFERVIVLPSSVDVSVDEVRETLSRTGALILARERESHRQLRGLCRTDTAHDCAFFFDFGSYRRRGEGLLTAYRTDAESASGGRTPPGNDDISSTCGTLDGWLRTIAGHAVVETDRAHVMIAAAMLGKKVRYWPSGYHKVPAIAEYALSGFPVERIPD
jgi:exopolysaccharide biosynthesis predicted pyruvyltransferase EpsI